MSSLAYAAWLSEREAVLRFPYDEATLRLIRAIPGRRWDPEGKSWRIPLDPERADSIARLLENMRGATLDDRLARALKGLREQRDPGEIVLDLALCDQAWMISFAADHAPTAVESLLAHPAATRLDRIGRALIPVDEYAAGLVEILRPGYSGRLRVAARVESALAALRSAKHAPAPRETVVLRPGRSGGEWVLLAPEHVVQARALAEEAGLGYQVTPGGSIAFLAREGDAHELKHLISRLDGASVDGRVSRWLTRMTLWYGHLDAMGDRDRRVFTLACEPHRLPGRVREASETHPGGATLPLTRESWELLRDWGMGAPASAAAGRCIRALEDGRRAPGAILALSGSSPDEMFVLVRGYDARVLEEFGQIPGVLPSSGGAARNRSEDEAPEIRADPFCVPDLDAFLQRHDVHVEEIALEALQRIREEHAHAAGIVAMSAATDADLDPVPGLHGELKPFQRAGVRYLLDRRRAFLADEQGLGKTIQALAALQADSAFPAIIVCPASLKLNWVREAERWLPARTVQILTGVKNNALHIPADITVVNYDVLAARLPTVTSLGARALVLDESHACKTPTAKRTQAAIALARLIPRDGLVLALTGTPVLNRPDELVSQLRIVGRLDDFGSGAGFSRRFKGADANLRLHWHLRARGYARRLKGDVLPQLPAKTRSIVPVEIDNEREYRLAEQNLIAWLRTLPLDLSALTAKEAAALRAEQLVRIGALKLLAARGKLRTALAWISEFLETGEPLVVFAHHREIQNAVLERFPKALHILGKDSQAARDTAVREFQDTAQHQLIVCSVKAAGQGLTLTKASNEVFLELGWTPAEHDQAEDRCHRIGQHDAVTAYYLLAADTIDEMIAELLDYKREVVDAVTDGREGESQSIREMLVRQLTTGHTVLAAA